MKNARKIYTDYINAMNNDITTRELVAYQDYGDSFAIMALTTKRDDESSWTDFMVMRIDYYGNVDPIRTFSSLAPAITAFSALAYDSQPIISLPF